MSEQQRKWGRAIPAGIAALLLALPASAANDSDRIADLEAKVNRLVEEVQQMRAELVGVLLDLSKILTELRKEG